MGWIAAVGKRGQIAEQPEPPPGGTPTYGPVVGVQATRDNTAMQSVAHPGGTVVTVPPGQLTQTTLAQNPGARFWVTKGSHLVTSSLTPSANQKFWFESAASNRTTENTAVVHANNAVFAEYMIGGAASGVEIRGGVFMNYALTTSSPFHAAIRPKSATGWLVQDAEIGPNGRQGIRECGDNFVWRRLYVHDNGFYGVNTETSPRGAGVRLTGGLMEYCRLFRNSTAVHGTANDAGQKFLHCNNSTFRYNWVNAHEGAGLWWDFQHQGHQIHDNVIENCWDWGLFYEWSFGGTKIYRNYLLNNGENSQPNVGFLNKTQLFLSTCDGSTVPGGIEVYRNVVDGNSYSPGSGVGYLLGIANHTFPTRPTSKSINIHDNQLWLRGTSGERVGGSDQNATKTMWTEPTLQWENNQYRVGSMSPSYWKWDSGSGVGTAKSWTAWQGFGFDDTGTRILI
jgi:hypothetical protein